MNFKIGDKVRFNTSCGRYMFDNHKKARGVVTGFWNDQIYVDVLNDKAFEKGWKGRGRNYIGYLFEQSSLIKVRSWRFWK